MAENNKELQLDEGFQEVSLDDGFEDVPLNEAPMPEVSPTQAFATSAITQGPLGFGDEAYGAISAALQHPEVFQGPTPFSPTLPGSDEPANLQALLKTYQEQRDAARLATQAGEQQQPGAALAGSIAGGLTVPLSAGTQLAKGAPMLARMAQGAKIGAGAGLATGLGQTEDVTALPQVAEDVATYGAGGALFGGALPPVIGAAKGTANLVKGGIRYAGEKILGPIGEAFKTGVGGELVVGQEGAAKAGKEISEFASGIGPKFKSQLDRLGSLKNKIIEQAEKVGVKVDEEAINAKIDDALQREPESRLPEVRRELEELQELLRTYKTGKLVKREIKTELPTGKEQVRHIEELKIAEQKAIDSGVDPSDIDTVYEQVDVPGKVAAVVRQRMTNDEGAVTYKKLASRLVNEEELPQIKTSTETVREGAADLTSPTTIEQLRKDLAQKTKFGEKPFQSKEVLKEAGKLTEGVRDTLREAKPQLQTVDKAISDLKNAAESIGITDTKELNEQGIMNKIVSLIDAQRKGGASGIKAREQIDQFIERLNSVNPKMASAIKDRFKTLSDKVDVITEANKSISFLTPLSATRTLATGASNVAGYGLHKLTKMPSEKVADISNTITQTNSGQAARDVANALRKSLREDDKGKNAIMFGLMQNPAYRQILEQYIPKDEEQMK